MTDKGAAATEMAQGEAAGEPRRRGRRGRLRARKAARAAMALGVSASLLALLLLNVAPFGVELTYRVEMGSREGGDLPLRASYSLGANEYGRDFHVEGSRMADEEAAFSLNVPYRSFDRAEVRLRYVGDPEELLLGMTCARSAWREDKPVHNAALNTLGWERVEDGGVTLLQKEKTYSSVTEFSDAMKTLSDRGMPAPTVPTTAVYHADEPPMFKGEGSPAGEGTSVGMSLRGEHRARVYVREGHLQVSFSKHDLNMYAGEDPLVFRVLDAGECIFKQVVEDDGDAAASFRTSSPQEICVCLPELAEGYYALEWGCGADVLIKDIWTSSRHLAFMESLFVAQDQLHGLGPSGPLSLYTPARVVGAVTWFPEAVQEVHIDGVAPLRIDEVDEVIARELPPGIKEMRSPKRGLLLHAPGSCFGVSRESLLVPSSVPFTPDLSLQDISFILAAYTPPGRSGGAYEQVLHFDMRELDIANHLLRLVVTAPGLGSRGETVRIRSIEVKLFKG